MYRQPVRMTYERAAEVWRAMNGDKEAGRYVSVNEAEDYVNAPTFGEFLERNTGRIQLFEYRVPAHL